MTTTEVAPVALPMVIVLAAAPVPTLIACATALLPTLIAPAEEFTDNAPAELSDIVPVDEADKLPVPERRLTEAAPVAEPIVTTLSIAPVAMLTVLIPVPPVAIDTV